MNELTVTLWNIPVKYLTLVIKAMEDDARNEILEGNYENARTILYDLNQIKEEIARKSLENDNS